MAEEKKANSRIEKTPFQKVLISHYISSTLLTVVETCEEIRLLNEIRLFVDALSKSNKETLNLRYWKIAQGFFDEKDIKKDEDGAPVEALAKCLEFDEKTITVFFGFGHFLKEPACQQFIKDMYTQFQGKKKFAIFLVHSLSEIEPQIANYVIGVKHEKPDPYLIEKTSLEEVCYTIDENGKKILKINLDEPTKKSVIDAVLGLPKTQIDDFFHIAATQNRKFEEIDVPTLRKLKQNTFKTTSLVDIIETNVNFADVGGMDNLKEWIDLRKDSYTDEAIEYGLTPPNGVLLFGVPGCGKSLVARAIAARMGLPLLLFDVGRSMDKYIGNSESNVTRVLEIAEAMAPSCLFIDEMEKGFSGVASSNNTDGGVSARLFGKFLSWMQDKKKPVFVIGTCNSISNLPPELLRKGRFDCLFFVDLPSNEERREIFKIHFLKRKRDPNKYDLDLLVDKTFNFSGAEIEELIKSSLFKSFSQKRDLLQQDLLEEASKVVTLYATAQNDINRLREWAKQRTVLASKPSGSQVKDKSRKSVKPNNEQLSISLEEIVEE